MLDELLAVVEKFAAKFGCRGLLQLLKEGGGEGGRGEVSGGEEFVQVGLALGIESAGLKCGDLFAEVVALQTSGEELLFEASDLGGGRGVLALTERLGRGGVDHRVDADDIADRLDGGAIGGALGEHDMRHADAGEIGVGQSKKRAARFGVEDADVSSDATVLKARIDDVADEVAGAAVAGLQAIGSVVEEDRLLVVERDRFAERGFGVVVAVLGVWSREGDVEDQSGGGVDGERLAPVGEVFGERIVRHRSWPVRCGKGGV